MGALVNIASQQTLCWLAGSAKLQYKDKHIAKIASLTQILLQVALMQRTAKAHTVHGAAQGS